MVLGKTGINIFLVTRNMKCNSNRTEGGKNSVLLHRPNPPPKTTPVYRTHRMVPRGTSSIEDLYREFGFPAPDFGNGETSYIQTRVFPVSENGAQPFFVERYAT